MELGCKIAIHNLALGVGMDPTSITNYDVLVEPPIPGKTGDYQFAKHKSHVGNNRLQVFLNLYRPAYNGALQRGAFSECNGIVDTIVSTVCHQCVPRGRFLRSSMVAAGDGKDVVLWNQVNEDSAKTLLHEVLQPAKPAMNFGAFPQKPVMDLGVFPSKVDDGAQKRRRRSSLLRRSASESMLGMVLDNKKKLSRIDQFQQLQGREDPTWKSAGDEKHGELGILTLNRMDIILTPARNALDPNSVSIGNNRLHILVAMQSSKYQQASSDRQEAILREVVQTVHTFWRGRFLVDGPDGYEELDWEEAINALRSIFDMRSGQQLPKRRSLPAERGISELPRQPRPAGLHRQASMPMLLSTSMSMIPSGASIDLPDVSRLRSAAVKSLQKQKARQTIANRLEGTTRRNGSENQVQQKNHVPQQDPQMAQNQYLQNQLQHHPFQAFAAHGAGMPRKRESTVLGKLDATLMEQLVEDFDDADCNESDDAEPLPPTNSNKFGSQFSGSGRDPFL
jgi:hypothetical protein